jgi:hypothetical protein
VEKLLASAKPSAEPYGVQAWLPPAEAAATAGAELSFLTRPTGLLGELCSWINATAMKEQPLLTLGCSLAFLGTLFGRKVRDTLDSRTNLYCMGVAPSSAGKAHAMNSIRKLALAAGCTDLLGGDDIASDSAIEDRMSRVQSTLFLWDEIGHLLAHIKSGISKNHQLVVSLLMKLYSNAGTVYKGREYAEAERQRTIIQPCCCIYGTSTPERFTDGLSPAELQDGWLSRCLVFYSTADPEKRRGLYGSPPPMSLVEQVTAWYARKIDPPPGTPDIAQFVAPNGMVRPPDQLVVQSTAEAEAIFFAFDHKAVISGRKNPPAAAMWKKCEENARRIALIVAVGESFDKPVVTAAAADYACRLVGFLTREFIRTIMPEVVTGKTDYDKRKLVAAIESAGVKGCTKSVVTRRSQSLTKRTRNDMLDDLVEAGEIAAKVEGKTVMYWTAANFALRLASQEPQQ